MKSERKDTASKVIKASPEAIYNAIIDPGALVCWLPPENMKAQIQQFEPWEGGAYQITLTYDRPDDGKYGKSSEGTDITHGKFIELVNGKRVSQSVEFVSDNPAFAGRMIMTYELAVVNDGTEVTIIAEHVPEGISTEDHRAGISSTLKNLAAYLE
jgi:uncharacterized protein YndB with AHSA1/START domain